MSVEGEASTRATQTITSGCNEIGEAGPAGIEALVNKVLPSMTKAVETTSGKRLVHELTTWFLLALSTGTADTGPSAQTYRGILLAYPFPEEQMVWKPTQ